MFFVAVRRTSRRALRRVGHAGARETGDAYVRALVGYPFRPRTVQPGASAGYHGSMRKPQISLGRLVLAAGFIGAALGSGASIANYFATRPIKPSLQILVFALAVGPLVGAGACAPFGWFRCRLGAYIGFFAGLLLWTALIAVLSVLYD